MNTVDTISAIATGIGGAIAVVRIAGPEALAVGCRVWSGRVTPGPGHARKMLLGALVTAGSAGEPVLLVYMPGPNSYTGDDVVELHCHGGARAAKRAWDCTLAAGCRAAEPGEFTFRAFLNGKLDLTQAEAVCDLINAHSDTALHLAERQLAGALSRQIGAVRRELVDLLAECESRLDFPEEELDWRSPEECIIRLQEMRANLQRLCDGGRSGRILRDGVRVVLAGKPNAGKSSLLNLLLGQDRAIVTDIPGTTRDTLEEQVVLRNIPVRLTDTAGIRETVDPIEKFGVDRSRQSLEQAQIVFWLLDAAAADPQQELAELTRQVGRMSRVIAVWNKIDLVPERELPGAGVPTVRISVTAGRNIAALLDAFEELVWQGRHDEEPEVAVNARQQHLLENAVALLPEAVRELERGCWELAGVQLRAVIDELGAVTGEQADPDILENIFSRFCIGK